MTEPNLSASAESPDQCEIPAPAISQSDAVVQRARQALDGITEGEWEVVTCSGEQCGGEHPNGIWSKAAAYDVVRDEVNLTTADARFIAAAPTLIADLLGLVEVALPTALAQRDDALREMERLGGERDEACAWAAWFAAERDDVEETLEASQSAHIHAVRIHGMSIKQDAAELDRLTAERDELRATIERVWELADSYGHNAGARSTGISIADAITDALGGEA